MNAPRKSYPEIDETSAAKSTPPAGGERQHEIARLVAHAINNPLAALVLDLELAIEQMDALATGDATGRAADARKLLEAAMVAADRVKSVVENLRATTNADDAVRVLTAEPPVGPVPVPSRRGRVLVVDDDALVGVAVQRSLKDHDVLALSSAEDALQRIQAGERYDVILCDLIMPELTGMDLHAALARIDAAQAARMVFFTGGAVTTRARDFVRTTRNVVMDKPFDIHQLRALVAAHVK